MRYADRALDCLESQLAWCYHPGSEPASEPTALAALALAAYGRQGAGQRARAWLASAQAADGRVGIRLHDASPGWPTPLAVLAWNLCEPVGNAAHPVTASGSARPVATLPGSAVTAASGPHQEASRRAVDWLLSVEGETSDRPAYTGHDTTIVGWPWVVGTHSWVEPTAMSLLALKAVGRGNHPRAREAVRLLEDRLLASGGCNYGNTFVLGQALLPHVEPTGAALLALAGEGDRTGRIARSIAYLEGTLGPHTTSASLAYGLLGLAAHGRIPSESATWITGCTERSYRRGSSLELALLALAALGSDCPLISLPVHHQAA